MLLAIWSIMATHMADFIPGFSQPIQFLACILLYVIPSGAVLFIKVNFSKDDASYKLINITLIVTLILYTLAMILQITGISDLHETLYLSHITIVVNCCSLIFTLISIGIAKKKDNENKKKELGPIGNITFTTILLSVLILCFIADIVIFYSNSNSSIGICTRIGALFFILYLGIIAFQNLYNLDKAATHAKFIQKLAYTDGLTGINNRTSFQEKLTYLDNNIDNYRQIGIISFDVNNLKTVNDTLGHSIGDDLIISAANVIQQSFGEFASIYRIGGDEFVAIIEENNAEEICKMCSLQFNVNIQNFNNFNSKPYIMSIAHGSSFYNKGTQQTIKETLEESDNKMYVNKQEIKKKAST